MSIVNYKLFFLLAFLIIMPFATSKTIAMDASANMQMPFGLNMPLNTRIVDIVKSKVGDIKTMNGVLATKNTAKEAVNFYEIALKEMGFRIFSKTDNAKRIYIAAKRGKGDFFSISDYGSDHGLELGETRLTIIIRLAP